MRGCAHMLPVRKRLCTAQRAVSGGKSVTSTDRKYAIAHMQAHPLVSQQQPRRTCWLRFTVGGNTCQGSACAVSLSTAEDGEAIFFGRQRLRHSSVPQVNMYEAVIYGLTQALRHHATEVHIIGYKAEIVILQVCSTLMIRMLHTLPSFLCVAAGLCPSVLAAPAGSSHQSNAGGLAWLVQQAPSCRPLCAF